MKEAMMRIAIGADHGGYALKNDIKDFLKKSRYQVKDFGTFSAERCDYPPIGYKVAAGVAAGDFERGILICKSGFGMTIVANKVPGIRAAMLRDVDSALWSRKHNDANVAVFSGRSMTKSKAERILKKWLAAGFEGGRHARRVEQIIKIEEKTKLSAARRRRGK